MMDKSVVSLATNGAGDNSGSSEGNSKPNQALPLHQQELLADEVRYASNINANNSNGNYEDTVSNATVSPKSSKGVRGPTNYSLKQSASDNAKEEEENNNAKNPKKSEKTQSKTPFRRHHRTKTSQKCLTLTSKFRTEHPILQKLIPLCLTLTLFLAITKCISPSTLHNFFAWMEEHPHQGIAVYTIIYPLHMVFLLPCSPIVLGAGFVFKTQYGWVVGVSLCSILTLFGSLLGSVVCFYLGRYWIRGTVRQWSRKYPMFDAIDVAVSDNGFKIMCMLYLTPILPLAPASYMMGTTSMPIRPFAMAKIAALPNTVLHVYVGAATGTLFTHSTTTDGSTAESDGGSSRFHEASLSPEMLVLGILISFLSIACITIKMKKELQIVLDRQKEEKEGLLGNIDEEQNASNTLTNNNTTRQRHVSTKFDGEHSAFRPFVA